MVKKTKRKAFNFLRSYFDVLNELTNDKDKLDFLTAIINKQFLNEDPIELNFIVNLCYESQRHQIETSVKGWLRATKEELDNTLPTNPMTNPPTIPMTNPMTNPKEEEEEEEEKEEVKGKGKRFIPPTADEVRDYCLSRNNDVNPNKFINFYQSKGWVVGKAKMKDWKAAVRGWEKDSIESPKQLTIIDESNPEAIAEMLRLRKEQMMNEFRRQG
jgi:hypothetical protein